MAFSTDNILFSGILSVLP